MCQIGDVNISAAHGVKLKENEDMKNYLNVPEKWREKKVKLKVTVGHIIHIPGLVLKETGNLRKNENYLKDNITKVSKGTEET